MKILSRALIEDSYELIIKLLINTYVDINIMTCQVFSEHKIINILSD